MKKAMLMLENGHYQYGRAFAGSGTVFAEFVFNTAMSGYEEILTDPSYKGQCVVFTYPLIGNYGITTADMQSDSVHAEAIIVREASRTRSNFRSNLSLGEYLDNNGIIGLDRVDTRQLTRIIRSKGAMKGGITTEDVEPAEFHKQVIDSKSISDDNVYRSVISDKVITLDGNPSSDLKIIAIDFGIKNNIVSDLLKDYSKVHLVPYDDNFDAHISKLDYDGIFLSNGPGDPRIVEKIQNDIRGFIENRLPVTAICFGHQLIGRAFDLDVIKLPFGHHGGNHPVKYHPTGKIYITSQNHNYAIGMDSIKNNSDWILTWENIYDNTVSGMKHRELPINAVQFHPEASPGPNEANPKVFSDFLETIKKGRAARG
jgi:carbamoyl-phosphate synthase small subunit